MGLIVDYVRKIDDIEYYSSKIVENSDKLDLIEYQLIQKLTEMNEREAVKFLEKLEEETYYKAEHYLTEGVFKNLIGKLGNFFKKLWGKIKDLFGNKRYNLVRKWNAEVQELIDSYGFLVESKGIFGDILLENMVFEELVLFKDAVDKAGGLKQFIQKNLENAKNSLKNGKLLDDFKTDLEKFQMVSVDDNDADDEHKGTLTDPSPKPTSDKPIDIANILKSAESKVKFDNNYQIDNALIQSLEAELGATGDDGEPPKDSPHEEISSYLLTAIKKSGLYNDTNYLNNLKVSPKNLLKHISKFYSLKGNNIYKFLYGLTGKKSDLKGLNPVEFFALMGYMPEITVILNKKAKSLNGDGVDDIKIFFDDLRKVSKKYLGAPFDRNDMVTNLKSKKTKEEENEETPETQNITPEEQKVIENIKQKGIDEKTALEIVFNADKKGISTDDLNTVIDGLNDLKIIKKIPLFYDFFNAIVSLYDVDTFIKLINGIKDLGQFNKLLGKFIKLKDDKKKEIIDEILGVL